MIFQKTYSPAVIQHAARYVQDLCNSLSDTSGIQSPGNAIYNATSHNAFLVEVNFLFTI